MCSWLADHLQPKPFREKKKRNRKKKKSERKGKKIIAFNPPKSKQPNYNKNKTQSKPKIPSQTHRNKLGPHQGSGRESWV